MAILKNISATTELKPPRLIVYGTAGIGKTTFGCQAPNPIAVLSEDGTDGISVAKFPFESNRNVAISYDEINQALYEISMQEHNFQTVILDSISAMEKLILQKVCRDNNVTLITDLKYGKGYDLAISYWEKLIELLDYIRLKRNMSVILIGHTEVKRFEDPLTEGYDKYRLKANDKASAKLTEWCDALLFFSKKIYTTKRDGTFGKKIIKPTDGDRVIYTSESARFNAKNRYGLPGEIPLSWYDFVSQMTVCSTLDHNPKPAIEEEVEPVLSDEESS